MKFKSETFKAIKIKDSEQSLEIAELIVDAEVLISTPQGSEVAPDGDYVLEDGSEIKVKDGKILEVVKEAATEDAPEEQALATDEDEKVEETKNEDKEAELKAEIEALKEEIKALKGEFSVYPTKADLAKFQSDLTEELKKLENIPAEFSKVDNRVELQDQPTDYFAELAKSFARK